MQATKAIQTVQTDERIKREAEIAEKARDDRKAQAAVKRQAAAAKPKADSPKPTLPAAVFLDQLMMRGDTWTAVLAKSKAESERRGIKIYTRLGDLKAHVKARLAQGTFRAEMDDEKVKLIPVEKPKAAAKPEKPEPKAKPAVKMTLTSRAKMGAARKTGKATGKQVDKTTENGRQTVTEQPAPTTEQAA